MTLYSPQPPKRQPPKALWVLFDLDNGNPKSRNYLWWFKTRALAREHRRQQLSKPNAARLSQPQKWVPCD